MRSMGAESGISAGAIVDGSGLEHKANMRYFTASFAMSLSCDIQQQAVQNTVKHVAFLVARLYCLTLDYSRS